MSIRQILNHKYIEKKLGTVCIYFFSDGYLNPPLKRSLAISLTPVLCLAFIQSSSKPIFLANELQNVKNFI